MYEGPCSAYSTPRDDLVIYVSCLVLTALIYVMLSYEQSRQAILVLLSIFLSHYHSTVCFTISWLNLLLLVLISRKILDLCFWLQCIPAFHLEYIQILRSLQTLQTCSKVIASREVQAPHGDLRVKPPDSTILKAPRTPPSNHSWQAARCLNLRRPRAQSRRNSSASSWKQKTLSEITSPGRYTNPIQTPPEMPTKNYR